MVSKMASKPSFVIVKDEPEGLLHPHRKGRIDTQCLALSLHKSDLL